MKQLLILIISAVSIMHSIARADVTFTWTNPAQPLGVTIDTHSIYMRPHGSTGAYNPIVTGIPAGETLLVVPTIADGDQCFVMNSVSTTGVFSVDSNEACCTVVSNTCVTVPNAPAGFGVN